MFIQTRESAARRFSSKVIVGVGEGMQQGPLVRYEMRNTINPGILNMGHPCPLWYETPSMNK